MAFPLEWTRQEETTPNGQTVVACKAEYRGATLGVFGDAGGNWAIEVRFADGGVLGSVASDEEEGKRAAVGYVDERSATPAAGFEATSEAPAAGSGASEAAGEVGAPKEVRAEFPGAGAES